MTYFQKLKILTRWQAATCVTRYNQAIEMLLISLGSGIAFLFIFCIGTPLNLIVAVKDWTLDLIFGPFFGTDEAYKRLESILNGDKELKLPMDPE